jgi:hypothetical protein
MQKLSVGAAGKRTEAGQVNDSVCSICAKPMTSNKYGRHASCGRKANPNQHKEPSVRKPVTTDQIRVWRKTENEAVK